MQSIPNSTRGCGTLKEGGFYVRGNRSAHGYLKEWAWVLGEMVEGGKNPYANIKARGVSVINLPQTIQTCNTVLWSDNQEGLASDNPLCKKLPKVAVCDHIGESHYPSPLDFAEEVQALGLSRRVSPNEAKRIAELVAIEGAMPILFTHAKVPVFGKQKNFWGHEIQDNTPTWEIPEWGIYAKDYSGDDHQGISLLNLVRESKIAYSLSRNDVDMFIEQSFGISWITNTVYIAKKEDTDKHLDRIQHMGIEPVQLENEASV